MDNFIRKTDLATVEAQRAAPQNGIVQPNGDQYNNE